MLGIGFQSSPLKGTKLDSLVIRPTKTIRVYSAIIHLESGALHYGVAKFSREVFVLPKNDTRAGVQGLERPPHRSAHAPREYPCPS